MKSLHEVAYAIKAYITNPSRRPQITTKQDTCQVRVGKILGRMLVKECHLEADVFFAFTLQHKNIF